MGGGVEYVACTGAAVYLATGAASGCGSAVAGLLSCAAAKGLAD